MPDDRPTIPHVVAEGCLEERTWDLIQDLRVRETDTPCPHVERLANGRQVLPQALTAYGDAGFRSTTLCYACVRLAVQTHFPAWDTPNKEAQ
jgi:hypothetical protein